MKKKKKIQDHPDRISYHEGILFGFGIGIASAIVVFMTNVVFPEIGEASYSALLTYIVLFSFFTYAGFRTYQRDNCIYSSARTGALAAFLSITFTLLAFVIVDNLFFAVVSKQPEKIWGLSHSHYKSMELYINYSLLKGASIALPIGVILGGALGAIGGYIQEAIS